MTLNNLKWWSQLLRPFQGVCIVLLICIICGTNILIHECGDLREHLHIKSSNVRNIKHIKYMLPVKTNEGEWRLASESKVLLTFSTRWIMELPQIMSIRNVTETSETTVHLNKYSFLVLHSLCPASISSKLKSGFFHFLNLWCAVSTVHLLQ